LSATSPAQKTAISKFDFLDKGRRSFESHLKLAEENGAVLADMMWFVWYVSKRRAEKRSAFRHL